MGVLSSYMSAHHVYTWCAWRPWAGLTVVSSHVGAGNQIQVLYKGSQGS